MLLPSPSVAPAPEPHAEFFPVTVCYTVQARPEPGVMSRVVELFAKRGLVPHQWHSRVSDSGLAIEVHMGGVDRDVADYIARCMRQIVGVETVFTSETQPFG